MVHTKKVDDVILGLLVHIADLDASKRMVHILAMGDRITLGHKL